MKKETLKKIIKLHLKFLVNAPKTSREGVSYCDKFAEKLEQISPDFDVDKLDTIPYPRLVKQIKKLHQECLDLFEEYEEHAPIDVTHDLHNFQ